jgi:tRNA (mo5U34)-methyltransferase
MLNVSRPVMAFYPGSELSNDPSNWVGPNPAAVIGMLRTVGFKRFDIVMPPRPFPMRFVNAMQLKIRRGFGFWQQLPTDRIVVHAWK